MALLSTYYIHLRLLLLPAGTISKYSLVAGNWVANGSYATNFGGFGLAAANAGTGAALYVTTGLGANAANNVIKTTDDAGYNTIMSVTIPNVTLYTAPGGTTLKGIALRGGRCYAVCNCLTRNF